MFPARQFSTSFSAVLCSCWHSSDASERTERVASFCSVYVHSLIVNIVNKSTRRAQTSAKANLVRIWSPKFNRDLILVQSYICGKKFHKDPFTLCRDRRQIVEKCSISQCSRILKKSMDPDPEADDFQKLKSSSLSTDTFVVKFSGRSVQ